MSEGPREIEYVERRVAGERRSQFRRACDVVSGDPMRVLDLLHDLDALLAVWEEEIAQAETVEFDPKRVDGVVECQMALREALTRYRAQRSPR